jgi:uncharacterized RDD family membrane protein YckC
MGSCQQKVEVFFLRARPAIRPYRGKILGNLPVEQSQFAQLVAGKRLQSRRLRPDEQHIQALPQSLPLFDPAVRNHTRITLKNASISPTMAETPDQLTIDTPEQVAIRFPIAGIGSRFLAILADTIVQIIAWAVLFLIFFLVLASAPRAAGFIVNRIGDKWIVAAVIIVAFLLHWGYYTLFEAFWNGQTPGKRLCKLRVIRDSGRQITFFESLTRNLIRIVDAFPSFYAVGIVVMLCNRRNKRLGDFAAGTLVVHEHAPEPALWGGSASRTITAGAFTPIVPPAPVVDPNAVDLPADAVARLTPDDLNIIDHFFARAIDIDIARRRALAERLAQQMTAKMGIAMPQGVTPERVLESTARILRSIRR